MQWLSKLNDKLAKTRAFLTTPVSDLFKQNEINDEFWEKLEETLLQADVGIIATNELVEKLQKHAMENHLREASKLFDVFKNEVTEFLGKNPAPLKFTTDGPTVILIVGVNGAGKTTTIGKLASQFKEQGKKVMLAAADTFRAAAIDQLGIWAERAGVPMIKHKEGSDPAAVAFDAVVAGKARNIDLILIDTAGRLQTKTNLMEELKKTKQVLQKEIPLAPHETLLVLDATAGQNALSQAKLFKEAVDITGIILTKLDGSAKGGMLLAIRKELNIPVKFIGVGEKIEDLQVFDPHAFSEALLEE